jgi:hypothetical protein
MSSGTDSGSGGIIGRTGDPPIGDATGDWLSKLARPDERVGRSTSANELGNGSSGEGASGAHE